MLQIRLSKVPASEGSAGAKPSPVETVTVACPDHLVLADLPVAKGIGAATASSPIKTLGRRSRRQLGERVHFCVRCDFPIAIYGRLVISYTSYPVLIFMLNILFVAFLSHDRIIGVMCFYLISSEPALFEFLLKGQFEVQTQVKEVVSWEIFFVLPSPAPLSIKIMKRIKFIKKACWLNVSFLNCL